MFLFQTLGVPTVQRILVYKAPSPSPLMNRRYADDAQLHFVGWKEMSY